MDPTKKPATPSLLALCRQEQVFAPCIWDCRTAHAAELAGFHAVLLSGGQLAESVCGVPDIGLITADDLVQSTERICQYTSLPVIVDADDGFGETPLTTYRLVRRLIAAGVCFACGDEVIDYSFVERFILELPKKYGVEIVQCGYDRWNALSTVQKLEAAGVECVEIKQHSSVLHSPTKLLREKILSKEFRYDENPMLEINFQNARCTEDTNRNKYVNKKKSAGKVDEVVALINATYLVEQDMLFGHDSFVVQI